MSDLIKKRVQLKYPKVECELEPTPTVSGALEVTLIKPTGNLYHSGEHTLVHSKLNGDGYINPSNVDELVAKMQLLL